MLEQRDSHQALVEQSRAQLQQQLRDQPPAGAVGDNPEKIDKAMKSGLQLFARSYHTSLLLSGDKQGANYGLRQFWLGANVAYKTLPEAERSSL